MELKAIQRMSSSIDINEPGLGDLGVAVLLEC